MSTEKLRQQDAAAAAVAVAPRVTLPDLEAKIELVEYLRMGPAGKVTVCCVTMRNGFAFVGYSSPVHISNFDEKLGREISYNRAIEAVWAAEGYLLRERLHLEALG